MARFIANVNGDWWEFTDKQPLYFLDTDTLTEEQRKDVSESLDADKFEYVIMEYGRKVTIDGSL